MAPRLSELLGKPVSSVGCWSMVYSRSSSSSDIRHTSCRLALHHRAAVASHIPHPTCARSGPTALLCAARPLLIILPLQVKKLNDCIGDEVKKAVADAKEGEVR